MARAGDSHSCALKPDGTVVCWGHDIDGCVSEPPVGVRFTTIDAGSSVACGLRADDHKPICWGTDHFGVVSGTPSTPLATLSVRGAHACGVRESDGTAQCWGRDDLVSSTPADVKFAAVEVGNWHACAIRADDGKVQCWGQNDSDEVTGVPGSRVLTLSSGFSYSCAITSGNELLCWGQVPQ